MARDNNTKNHTSLAFLLPRNDDAMAYIIHKKPPSRNKATHNNMQPKHYMLYNITIYTTQKQTHRTLHQRHRRDLPTKTPRNARKEEQQGV